MRLSELNPVSRIRSAGFPLVAAPTPPTVEPLPGPELGDRYDTDWARRPVARATRVATQETLGRLVTTTLCRPEVRNTDRLENLHGAAVCVATHPRPLAPGLVIQSLPRPWRHEVVVAAAAAYFFDSVPKAAAAAWFWGAVPMERQRVSRRSALRAAELIEDGWSLVIFPEGGRSPDGWGQEHKGGAAYLAVRCGVPVVPVHICGTDRVLPKGSSLPRPARVTVNFGSPLEHGSDDARRFASRIEDSLEALADETVTDWYSARLRRHRRNSPSLRGPDIDSWRRDWELRNRPGTPADTDRRSWRDRALGNPPW